MLDDKQENKEEKALRYNEGKLEWSLIDYTALEPMVQQLMFGANKYSPNNWKKGMKISKIFDSLQRHLIAIHNGETHDKESGVHHMGGVLCNALFMSWYLTTAEGQAKIIPEVEEPQERIISIDSVLSKRIEETGVNWQNNGPHNREKINTN